jgi:citronellol/citronellal dehydrogenase
LSNSVASEPTGFANREDLAVVRGEETDMDRPPQQEPDPASFRADLLADQVCVVSGFGTGLGRATALALAGAGATVVGCGRRLEPLAQTVALITEAGGRADADSLDIRDEGAVDRFFDLVLERHGRLDVLVNNAGGQFFGPAEDVSPKGLRTVVELNLVGTWTMIRAAATKAFIPQGSGRIVNITASPHHGAPGFMATMAARAGVENMTRTLATEWARHGVTAVAVAVGAFGSDVVWQKYPPEMVDTWASRTPVGRIGRPEELGELVTFLASPASRYITGTVVTIDGGRDNAERSRPVLGEARRGDHDASAEAGA